MICHGKSIAMVPGYPLVPHMFGNGFQKDVLHGPYWGWGGAGSPGVSGICHLACIGDEHSKSIFPVVWEISHHWDGSKVSLVILLPISIKSLWLFSETSHLAGSYCIYH